MKQRLISLALLASIVGGAAYGVTLVQAQEAKQEQELEQTSDVTCESGAYGQGQICGVTTTQRARQRQEIVIRENGAVLQPHQVVDTALDTRTIATIAGIAVSGMASAAGYVKTKHL